MINRRTTLAIISALLFNILSAHAQDSTALHYATLINPQTISRHLHILASDSLEGRETAKPGMQKAAAYFSSQFNLYGMKPVSKGSYFQNVPLVQHSATTIDIVAGNRLFEPGADFYTTEIPADINLKDDNIVFAGYGIVDAASGWDDYKTINIEGKIVLIIDGEPMDKEGKYIITDSTVSSSWISDRKRKIEIAKEKKAGAIFFISNDYDGTSARIKRWVANGRINLDNTTIETPVIYIPRQAAESIMTAANTSLKKIESKSVKSERSMATTLNTSIQISYSAKKTSCTNVLGYVEGTDLKNELIIISGHLDHLGKKDDKIYYGADDNGSGCATILNMAEAFMKAKTEGNGPRRSILFIAFTGEEKGLLGSEYYTSNPTFPLEKTIANLNIDMIGRKDTMERNGAAYTYIIGSNKLSTGLHTINETANDRCCDLQLDYKYNDPEDKLRLYYRSDHYNFVKNKIPAIFYFTGLHEDYHEPTDTVDKVDFSKTATIGKLIFSTAWELANRNDRIVVDVVDDFK